MANVVLLMSDEHDPRYSSVHGHPFVATPHLQRLADRGTAYDNAYCPSPLCVPSRASFMTGRWVHEIDRWNNCKIIEDRFPSYGGVLSDQGVHTVFCGSAGNLYRDPHQLGFDETPLVVATGRKLNPAAVQVGPPEPAPAKTEAPSGAVDDRFAGDDRYVDRAVEWLTDTAPGIDRPFVLIVNVTSPHPPYTADAPGWEAYTDHADLPDHDADHPAAAHPSLQDLRTRAGWAYPPELTADLRRGYYAAITHVDTLLGRLIDAVDAAPFADDTVIGYTTDHGEMLGTFGVWGKCTLNDRAAKVPLVMAGPGFAAGRHVRTPVSLLDAQASLFDITGTERPDGWRGEPLSTIGDDDPTRAVFAEFHGPGPRGGAFLLRKGNWKLLHHLDAPHQLFDLDADPDELHDRYAERPDVAADLEAELRAVCDPESVGRRSLAYRERQLATLAAYREQLGEDATVVDWGVPLPASVDDAATTTGSRS